MVTRKARCGAMHFAGRRILRLAVIDLIRQEGEISFGSPDGVDGELPLAPALVL